jgi:hypothetical protein
MAFSRKVDRSLKTCHSEASAPKKSLSLRSLSAEESLVRGSSSPWNGAEGHRFRDSSPKRLLRLRRLGMTGPLKRLIFLENAIIPPTLLLTISHIIMSDAMCGARPRTE